VGPFDVIVGYDAAGILSLDFASDFRVQETWGYKTVQAISQQYLSFRQGHNFTCDREAD